MPSRNHSLLVFVACVTAAQAMSAQPQVRVAQIISAQGVVEVRRGSAAPWVLARTGQELIGSDGLRTGGFAVAKLKFEAGVQWSMAAASELVLGDAVAGGTSSILVRLLKGGVVAKWNPDRRPAARTAASVVVETASGRASIVGTEWSIRVDDDGRTAVAVQDGAVELSNEHGGITVRANQEAEMVVGRAPVLRLLNPRDRVQWVADYAADPARLAAAESGPARADLDLAVADAAAGRTAAAIERLDRNASSGAAPANVVLALTDLMIAGGDLASARARGEAGRARYPADARFDALLSRIALFEDRIADSRTLADGATIKDPASIEGWLALGDWARSEGDGAVAQRAFRQALLLDPKDARGWFGLGSVETEREAFAPARRSLTQALALDPLGPGYRGEMGTLETLANNFAAAKQEYAQALKDRPDDYVALTGRALLALKQGLEAEALDLLLQATLLEPNYARAQMYLGVTYYRLRRHDDAIAALHRASALDPKDPLPLMAESAIHTDLYAPASALAAARKARDVMPYLKSLNQLANTPQGTANLGNSVAFFGMEAWAQHLAQESYYPFWAGSHLFLGDRYSSPYARASEYYQGLLADPTVFGGSPLFQTLLPRAGHYQGLEMSAARDAAKLRRTDARASVNGYVNSVVPIGYAFSADGGRWHSTLAPPAGLDRETHAPSSVSAAVGIAPGSRWGFYTAGSYSRDRERFPFGNTNNVWSGTGGRLDAGGSFRPSPVANFAVKLGFGTGKAQTPIPPFIPRLELGGDEADVQARYMHLLSGRHELSAGFNIATGRQQADFDFLGIDLSFDRDLSSRHTFASARTTWGPALVQADVFVNRDRSAFGTTQPYVSTVVEPRLGTAIRFGSGVLRGAFQQRTQPLAATSTLGPVATAGIPVDDSFLQGGGNQRRGRVQLDWEWSSRTFTTVFADYQKLKNLTELNGLDKESEKYFRSLGPTVGADLTPYFAKSLTHLRDVGRDTSRLNVSPQARLEGDPSVVNGRASTVGLAVNRVLTTMISVETHYSFTSSSDGGRPFLFVPAHLFSLGTTFVSPRRLYLSGEVLHRSRRFSPGAEIDDRVERPAEWTGDLNGYWESRDKRWALEFIASNLFAKSASPAYSVNAKIRR